MAGKKRSKRFFNSMSYVEVQRANSKNRSRLKSEDQAWLKANGYKNVGWENVISLYQKIEEFLDLSHFEEMSLEELFIEADRIGNQYLTPQEIEVFNQQLAQEVAEIETLIDQQFPDTEVEVIDYRAKPAQKSHQKRNIKKHRTAKR